MEKSIIITQKNLDQIDHYLKEFTKLSNDFNKDNNKPNSEYWKGQVFGIIKVIGELEIKHLFNVDYYLNNLP